MVSDEVTAPAEIDVPTPQMTRDEFLAEREVKVALMEKQQQFLDQWLLTLAGGALGLTLTFLRDHDSAGSQPWLVATGMALLVLSILSVLTSIIFSQRSISLRIDALDSWCEGGFTSGHPSERDVKKSLWANLTGHANTISAVTLMGGLVSISLFVSINLFQPHGGTDNMQGNGNSGHKGGVTVPTTRGAEIKPPPAQPRPAQSSQTGGSSQGGKK